MKRMMINGRPTGRGVDHGLIRDSITFFERTVFKACIDGLSIVQLTVNFIPGLQKQYNTTGFSGWTDDPLKPSKFVIELDEALDRKTAIITAAHEFTHVKQYAMGEKIDAIDGKSVRWMGMRVVPDDVHYYDHPWEIEAHGREYGMYDRFINKMNAEIDPATIVGNHLRSV